MSVRDVRAPAPVNQYMGGLILSFAFVVVQLAVGCQWEACLGFALALCFGWWACAAARPWQSLMGLLTISLYLKAVLFGCAAKSLLLQRMDVGVLAAGATGFVFASGFAGVWLAVLLLRRLPFPSRAVLWRPSDSRSWLVLWLVFLVMGGASWAFIFLSNIDVAVRSEFDVPLVASRLYIVPSLFATFFPIAPAAAVFYLASRGGRRLIGHPVVLMSLFVCAVPGILQGRKNPVMIPFAAVWLAVLLVRGLRYKPLWGWTTACLAVLMLVVFPFVQFGRYSFDRGPLGDRLAAVERVGKMFSSAEEYQTMYKGALDLRSS